jgi:hypothetical protein
VPNLLVSGDSYASFPCRRCSLLPSSDGRLPDLAVSCRACARSAVGSAARAASAFSFDSGSLQAPEASAKTREEKRFARYDKDKDGKVEAGEYLAARKRNFDKLDIDHNGALSFQEYAAKGIDKFNAAGGRKGWLSAAEFVATAPPPAKHKLGCSCSRAPQVASDNGDDNNN